MDKLEKSKYRNELLVNYAKELMKRTSKNNNQEVSDPDFDLLHFCTQQIVFENDNLEELLDSYIRCAENEKMGLHENIAGSVEKGISGFQFFSNDIEFTYHSLKNVIFRRIDSIFSKLSNEQQNAFVEQVINPRIKLAESNSLASQNSLNRYNDSEYYENKIQLIMEVYNISRSEAALQIVFNMNYIGRNKIQNDACINSLIELSDKLTKSTQFEVNNNEISTGRHI